MATPPSCGVVQGRSYGSIEIITVAVTGPATSGAPGSPNFHTNTITIDIIIIISTYLGEIGVDLPLEGVALLFHLGELHLGLAEPLLRLPEAVHQLVPLVQHGDHELFEIGIFAGELGAPLADAVLRYCRHHVAHHVPHFGRSPRHTHRPQ